MLIIIIERAPKIQKNKIKIKKEKEAHGLRPECPNSQKQGQVAARVLLVGKGNWAVRERAEHDVEPECQGTDQKADGWKASNTGLQLGLISWDWIISNK